MPRQPSDILVARETFLVVIDGREHVVHKGDRVRSGHPVHMAQPDRFEPIDSGLKFDFDPPVEKATAAPGEKRNR